MPKSKVMRSRLRLVFHLPFLVTIATLLVWHFYRVSFLSSLWATCLPTHEFWFVRYGGSWPLFGSFALVLLLLIGWNTVAWFDPEARTRVDRIILILNAGALLSVVFVLSRLIEVAQISSYVWESGYAVWNRTEEEYFPECGAAEPYVGIWDVASVEIPLLGQHFPYGWIEFRRNLTFSASRSRFVDPVEGRWRPWERDLAILWTEDLEGVWNLRLEDSRLTLVTPDSMGTPISRIVLLRRSDTYHSR